jgi:hypothetical protein
MGHTPRNVRLPHTYEVLGGVVGCFATLFAAIHVRLLGRIVERVLALPMPEVDGRKSQARNELRNDNQCGKSSRQRDDQVRASHCAYGSSTAEACGLRILRMGSHVIISHQRPGGVACLGGSNIDTELHATRRRSPQASYSYRVGWMLGCSIVSVAVPVRVAHDVVGCIGR